MLAIHTTLLSRSELTSIYFGKDWAANIEQIQRLGFKIDDGGLYDSDFTSHKIKYFFGPALFASYLFVVVQAITIDIIFPKFKYRSLMVITSKADAVVSGLQYVHYPNDIIRLPARDHYEGNDINNEVIIVSTSVLEYKKLKLRLLFQIQKLKFYLINWINLLLIIKLISINLFTIKLNQTKPFVIFHSHGLTLVKYSLP